jgi:hypothetical protein
MGRSGGYASEQLVVKWKTRKLRRLLVPSKEGQNLVEPKNGQGIAETLQIATVTLTLRSQWGSRPHHSVQGRIALRLLIL